MILIFDLRGENYFLFISFGVTQVPEALATTIGSSKKSAAEALMSFLETTTFLASNFMCLEVERIASMSHCSLSRVRVGQHHRRYA